MSNKVLDLTMTLADAIKTSAEMTRMKAAEDALMADAEAKGTYDEFLAMQARLEETSCGQSSAASDARQRKFEEKKKTAEQNPLISEFIAASSAYDQLLGQVNTILMNAVNPQSSCAPTSCSSCSGCA